MIVDFLEVELEWRLDGVVMVCGWVQNKPAATGADKGHFRARRNAEGHVLKHLQARLVAAAVGEKKKRD